MLIGIVFAAISGAVANTGVFLQKVALDSRRPTEHPFAAFKRPAWLAGLALLQLGWYFQVAALRSAPLYLVQPIAAAGIGVLVVLARARLREPVSMGLILAIGTVVAGAGLLALSSLQPSNSTTTQSAPLGALAVLGVLALGLGGYASASKTFRTAGQSVTAGILYGAAVALTKPVAGQLATVDLASVGNILSHKEIYLVDLVSTVGLYFNQMALASGRASVVAPVVLATMTVLPVVFGVVIFGEGLPPYPGRAAVAAGGLACLVGVVLLARMDTEVPLHDQRAGSRGAVTTGAAGSGGAGSEESSPTTGRSGRSPSSTTSAS